MKVTSKGQVTIPQTVREEMGIRPAASEVEFVREESGRWFILKKEPRSEQVSRFRTAHKVGKPVMTTEQILSLTRN